MANVRGGDKLDRRLAEIAQRVSNPGTLRVGFFDDVIYPNGASVALIAMIQDLGAPRAGIPPRPFFRNMVANNKALWPGTLMGILRANDFNGTRSLRIMGDVIAGQLNKSIIDTNAPPLKPATIARKGFDKPLIHTSLMINHIGVEVS